MTDHYYEHPLVNIHYYRFGRGSRNMFCFHGYGMHGKQFRVLEETLGDQYTFYGFDLFFHKETKLQDQSLSAVKKGIKKSEVGKLFEAFCDSNSIDKFSVIAYSMGSHYATTLVEEIPHRIEELFAAAPSSLKPGRIINFLSANPVGNKMLERMALSRKALPNLLLALKKTRIIDSKAYEILFRELETAELRFSFYACASYMRFMKLDNRRFVSKLNDHNIRSVFIFGERDKSYPAGIGRTVIPKIKFARQLIIDENHDMINPNFARILQGVVNDH